MDTSPLVSVIIATRDRPTLLEDAIASILDQRYEPLELIVVDDGSGPDTAAVIERAASDPRVDSLRHAAARGAAAARNAGAAAARGEFLLFEDDDCRSAPGRVAALAAALKSRPDAGYAYCHARQIETSGVEVRKGGEGPWSVGTPAVLIRRRVFHEVGGFDPELPRLVDFDLWTRVLARYPAVEVPEVLFETTRSDRGLSASDDALVSAAERLLLKYGPNDLPDRHRSIMHRRLGGALLLQGLKRLALRHFFAGVRSCPWCPRSWAAFVVALAGPGIYRAALGRLP